MSTQATANPRRTTLAQLPGPTCLVARAGCQHAATRVVQTEDGPVPACGRCAD